MEPILQVKNLSVEIKYDDKNLKILKNISYELFPSKTLAIVGESGCGKTISALSVLRLLPDSAKIASGKIIYKGIDLLKLSHEEIRKIRGGKISMVFQEPMTSLNPVMTIGRQISEAITEHTDADNREALEKSAVLLEKAAVGRAKNRLNDYPHNFSGGMRQRVMIAMAISCNPDIIIADEPTTALDVTIQAQILALMSKLQKENRMSLILITHNLGIVAQTADDVAVFYAGMIMEKSTARELFREPKHPYTRALLESLPEIGSRKKTLPAIKGLPPGFDQDLPGCPFAPRCPSAFDKCFKQEPPEFETGNGRISKCWLYEKAIRQQGN
ncbi:MAG: ABC transporter ATP-binding protein [Elusimicrobia bacterium]|nr:ABC transporter ATP-binding protein [Elusimicrobiota bacterium]